MKLYQLKNLKTGKLIPRKMNEAEMETLRNTVLPGSPNRKMVDLYEVEEFDVPVKSGRTFTPPALPPLTNPTTPNVLPRGKMVDVRAKEETKGPAAAGQT